MNYIMVLNDGETFTNLENCYIRSVPDNFDTEQIEEVLDNPDDDYHLVRFDTDEQGAFFVTQGGLKLRLLEGC